MSKEEIIKIGKNPELKNNKDLINTRDVLIKEFNSVKQFIIDLTRHLDSVEILYNKVNQELKKRNLK